MLTTKQALDRIASAIAPRLKSGGFRKSGRAWRRATDTDLVQVINLQGSVWNADTNGRCTLNAGVYAPRLAELLGIGRITDAPTEADCHLRVRPAMLARGRDTWCEFDTAQPATIERAIAELTEVLTQFALPWLETHATLPDARDALQRAAQWWWAAACSLALNDTVAAADLLSRALQGAPAGRVPHLRRWGAQHDLLTDRSAEQPGT